MQKPANRDVNDMHSMWGTVNLVSDCNLAKVIEEKRMLRERSQMMTRPPKNMILKFKMNFMRKFAMMKTMMIGLMALNQIGDISGKKPL